ncbi:acetate--CoA ligase family protein [Paraburkholderia terricola]|uniref:Acetyltransferase n=1 Tax=Paraburkholderia terricola TaxID=169427 RepID=A0A1M6T3P4_9BURK|nr:MULTISPECIES: acetate--CoA ligase [Paraburkholderia]SDO70456.1 acetyltransferase [Paraburkholderia sediminicola]SHK51516.1 acetyltransferase [Paraburkholderia terricola]
MSDKDFKYLFEPRSIAVVGVSDDAGRPGSQAVRALLNNGYAGKIFPVNPKYEQFEGLRCFGSVSEIDEPIDLVVVGVPAAGVLPVLEASVEKHVPFAVVLSGGFRESGPEGIEREQRMLELARRGGMRIIGPNCLGFANIHSNVYAAFGSITREPKLKRGGVSLVTQSGGFGYSLALACSAAGIGFRHVIATGNETDIDTVQLIDALLDDPETQIILAYIEGTRDGRALLDVGRRAMAVGKPVLLWKGGVTEQGARAAASHTASMTGTYDFYRALFKQTGIIEINEIHEAADYLKALAGAKYPQGNGVAVMGVSGGSAIVFADAGEPEGLSLCELDVQTQHKLQAVVPNIGAVHNPIDLTAGYFSPNNGEKLATAVQAVLDAPNVHAVCVNLATTGKVGSLAAAEVLARLAAAATKPIVVFSSAPASEIGDALARFDEANIAVLPSPSGAARSIAMLARYEQAKRRVSREQGANSVATSPADGRITATGGALSENDSKKILAAAGIPVTRDVIVTTADGAVFDDLKAPLVVKVVSADIPHKTEVGGVKVGIQTRADLKQAIDEVLANARKHVPTARIDGVLVSEMVRGGFELIAGVVNDVVFGPVVVVGAGGIYAELLGDSACRLAPFDEKTAREMVDELQCRRIMDGARGGAALDVDAIASALAALSRFAWENRESVQEIDINPLFALPEGVVAADALIVARGTAGARSE